MSSPVFDAFFAEFDHIDDYNAPRAYFQYGYDFDSPQDYSQVDLDDDSDKDESCRLDRFLHSDSLESFNPLVGPDDDSFHLKFPHEEAEKLTDASDWFVASDFYIEVSVIVADSRSVRILFGYSDNASCYISC